MGVHKVASHELATELDFSTSERARQRSERTLLIFISMVNVVSAAMVSRFLGFWNLLEGMTDCAAMTPMGTLLQDPVLT